MKRAGRRKASVAGQTRLLAKLRLEALPDREATVLDLLRTRGPMTVPQVSQVLGLSGPYGASRYVNNLREAGLAERVDHRRPHFYRITEHGRTVA